MGYFLPCPSVPPSHHQNDPNSHCLSLSSWPLRFNCLHANLKDILRCKSKLYHLPAQNLPKALPHIHLNSQCFAIVYRAEVPIFMAHIPHLRVTKPKYLCSRVPLLETLNCGCYCNLTSENLKNDSGRLRDFPKIASLVNVDMIFIIKSRNLNLYSELFLLCHRVPWSTNWKLYKLMTLKNNNSNNIDLSFNKNIVSNTWKLSVYFIHIRTLKLHLACPHSPPLLWPHGRGL